MPRGDNFKGERHPSAGRKKGSINKKDLANLETQRPKFLKALDRLLEIAQNDPDNEIAVKATLGIAKYFLPALSSINVKSDQPTEAQKIVIEVVRPNAGN
jgi:hypothetical protein